MPPIRSIHLLSPFLMSLLFACSTTTETHHRQLVGDLKSQDRALKVLREEIRYQRAAVETSPSDTSARRKLDELMLREEDAQRLRRDIKESADEKAWAEYEDTKGIFREVSPEERARHP